MLTVFLGGRNGHATNNTKEEIMSDLSKWNPFKFNRHTDKAKPTEQAVAKQQDRWDSFATFDRDMQHIMRSFFGNDEWFAPIARSARNQSWFGNFSPSAFRPSVDVTDNGTHLVVSAELPGLSKENVELHVHENTLHLKGQKVLQNENEEHGCYRTERFFGSFQRSIPLPQDVDPNGAEANFKEGVLTVKLPKLPEQKSEPKKIEF